MNNLKILRKTKRMTQAEIASIVGISQNNYSYWENDKVKIDNNSLQKLARFFNVSVDYILNLETPKQAPTLTDKERELLEMFRRCDKDMQNRILGYIEKTMEKKVEYGLER